MSNPLSIVIFGASGDLTARKLVPALYHLHRKNRLPEHVRIVGLSRSKMTDDQLRRHLRDFANKVSPDFDAASWDKFAPLIEYVSADASTREGLQPLLDWLVKVEENQRTDRVYYLSVKPALYEPIATILGGMGLSRERHGGPFRRLIVEKPFGRDKQSAEKLNETLHDHFDPGQVYRIDHYLGKETVQNILAFRFANTMFEPLWNRTYIDHIQITAAESNGIEDRGEFYDVSGVLRDMFQSHLLQVLAFALMEKPVEWGAEPLRGAKKSLLDAVRVYSPGEAAQNLVVGQYEGYHSAKGVDAKSRTPSFAALRLWVDNDRWRGVPMYLRSGKAMKVRVSEVVIQFKCPDGDTFFMPVCDPIRANRITLRIQPHESIRLSFQVKEPDTLDGLRLRNCNLLFDYASEFGKTALPEAYERLILDVIHGDPTLFTRSDVIERAWEIMDPIVAASERPSFEPIKYPRGSWGPPQADELLKAEHDIWRNPEDV